MRFIDAANVGFGSGLLAIYARSGDKWDLVLGMFGVFVGLWLPKDGKVE